MLDLMGELGSDGRKGEFEKFLELTGSMEFRVGSDGTVGFWGEKMGI